MTTCCCSLSQDHPRTSTRRACEAQTILDHGRLGHRTVFLVRWKARPLPTAARAPRGAPLLAAAAARNRAAAALPCSEKRAPIAPQGNGEKGDSWETQEHLAGAQPLVDQYAERAALRSAQDPERWDRAYAQLEVGTAFRHNHVVFWLGIAVVSQPGCHARMVTAVCRSSAN